MATIGRHDAVTELANGWRLSGPLGWAAWLGLHLVYLMGFRNRIKVFVDWAWNYLTYDRGSRLLRESDLTSVEARRMSQIGPRSTASSSCSMARSSSGVPCTFGPVNHLRPDSCQ